MESVQMNTRIGVELKRTGDEVLRRNGYTPSSAVQALWAYMAEKNTLPPFMRSGRASGTTDERLNMVEQNIGVAFRLFNEARGTSLEYNEADSLTDEELREYGWKQRGTFQE